LKLPQQQAKPKCILSLGSSIGNFEREAAPAFLTNFSNILQRDDCILIGLDACQDAEKIFHAYNDRLGVTHHFIRNGLANANRILGEEVFDIREWEIVGEYDAEAGRHQAFYQPSRDVVCRGITIEAGERVRVEESYKFSAVQSAKLWEAAGLIEGARFGTHDDQYSRWKRFFCCSWNPSPLELVSSSLRLPWIWNRGCTLDLSFPNPSKYSDS
jgi:uncharacterized SAM-dependent methyltransferase